MRDSFWFSGSLLIRFREHLRDLLWIMAFHGIKYFARDVLLIGKIYNPNNHVPVAYKLYMEGARQSGRDNVRKARLINSKVSVALSSCTKVSYVNFISTIDEAWRIHD